MLEALSGNLHLSSRLASLAIHRKAPDPYVWVDPYRPPGT